MARPFAFDCPNDAINALAEQLPVVGDVESVNIANANGRVLAVDVLADRDSPAADVSAMDGYAIRLADFGRSDAIPVSGESVPGNPPPSLADDAVIRIFTGAIVPPEAEAVVKREDTEELDGAIRFRDSAKGTQSGENIRRAGENAAAESTVLSGGSRLSAAKIATMANFGCYRTQVRRGLSIAVITTGDEVGVYDDQLPRPWQLRNSNHHSLSALLNELGCVQSVQSDHCIDDRAALLRLISERLDRCDAVLLTGGVSMGDYDYVPEIVKEVGGRIVFHGLPIRPGKPILGAATETGKLILGLPGNPVSATACCRRFATALLGKMSGATDWNSAQPTVNLQNPGDKTIPLHWMRLVRLTADGMAKPVASRGSGDLVSLGQSDGFCRSPTGKNQPGSLAVFRLVGGALMACSKAVLDRSSQQKDKHPAPLTHPFLILREPTPPFVRVRQATWPASSRRCRVGGFRQFGY